MARAGQETRIADVVVPVVFSDYIMERNLRQSKLVKSGIIQMSPEMERFLAGGSTQFTTPYWKTIVGKNESQIPSETENVKVNNITSGSFNTRRQMRIQAWGANALSAILSGDDPFGAIAQQVGDYWDDDAQATLMAEARGIYADNVTTNNGDMVIDLTKKGEGLAGNIDAEAIIDALFTQGDRWNEFTAIAMHSTPYETLVKQNLIDFTPTNVQNIGFGTYFGKTIIVDDYHTVDPEGKYITVLFKNGAFGYGMSNVGYEQTSIDRDENVGMGVEVLHNRRVFALHPYGFDWVEGSLDGLSPTNAELADGTHWKRAFKGEDAVKMTGLAFIKSNG